MPASAHAVVRVSEKPPGPAGALGLGVFSTSWRNKRVDRAVLQQCVLWRVTFPLLSPLCSVPTPMLPTPTLDQAHHSHRAAWDTQLPPSSRHSTRTRHTGTELRPNIVNALLLTPRAWLHSRLPGTRLGPPECTVQPHLQRVRPPRPTTLHGAEQWLPNCTCFGVRLEKKVLAQFVLWICYFHSLLDMVQTDRCIFFQWQSVAVETVKCARGKHFCCRMWWVLLM